MRPDYNLRRESQRESTNESFIIKNKNQDETEASQQIITTSHNPYEQMEQDKILLARRLAVECLSADRATDYQTWMEVGWCLHPGQDHTDPALLGGCDDLGEVGLQVSDR